MKRKTISITLMLFVICSYQINGQSKIADNQSDIEMVLPSGKFTIGANYWASHAGPAMWSDWNPDIVEKDLKKLSEAGIKTLRVFPLWPVFQPLTVHRAFQGSIEEYRFGEDPLPDTPAGRAGVDISAISKFETFVSLAEKYDIKLIVSLLTGWMSGRLFVPPALDGLNLLTDPEAVKWEIRYVRYFVSEFRNSPSIIAWDLGNECNCMSLASSSEQWVWISTIADAIKATDHSRPVISGIASRISEKGSNIQDTGENLDILTTHFYHTFTSNTELEALNTIRPVLAPVVENLINEDISGKPCFIEEMGTLGPLFGDDGPDGVKPGFLRSNLFSEWSHDCRGLFWWIAFDQGHLTQTPFDWNSRGSEYGLWYPDGKPKPVLKEIQKFSKFLSGFEYSPLPKRIIDGVCILTEGQDNWGVAFSSFLLAKQAGIDIGFQHAKQPLKNAGIYFLPSVNGAGVISQRRMQELLQKVKDGATLYISNDNGHIGPRFPEFTGLRVHSYTRGTFNDVITMKVTGNDMKISTGKKCILQAETAKILAVDQDGNPAFTCNNFGNGRIFYLNYPLEKFLATQPGVFDGDNKNEYREIYNEIRKSIASSKVLLTSSRKVGFTEHIVDETTRLIIAVNYFPSVESITIELKEGWKISKTFYGKNSGNMIELQPDDAVVFSVVKI
jgi:hypothetical protein